MCVCVCVYMRVCVVLGSYSRVTCQASDVSVCVCVINYYQYCMKLPVGAIAPTLSTCTGLSLGVPICLWLDSSRR